MYFKARVAAKQAGVWSAYSDFSAVVSLPKPTAPQAPILQVVSNSTLLVLWSAVPGADKYAVIVRDGVNLGGAL